VRHWAKKNLHKHKLDNLGYIKSLYGVDNDPEQLCHMNEILSSSSILHKLLMPMQMNLKWLQKADVQAKTRIVSPGATVD
jgi:hypothetical protein